MTEQTTFSLLYTLVDELKQANAQGQLEQCNTLLGEVQDFIDEHGDELRDGPDFAVLKRALEMRILIWPARDIVALLEGNYEAINRNRSLTITRDAANDNRYVFTLNRAPSTTRTDGPPRGNATRNAGADGFRSGFRGARGGFQGNNYRGGRGGYRSTGPQGGSSSHSGTPSVYIPQKSWADQ
jgi:hypothetical protein